MLRCKPDESKGVVVVFALILAALSFFFFLGNVAGKHGVAQDCVDYGKTKIYGKWYECRPK